MFEIPDFDVFDASYSTTHDLCEMERAFAIIATDEFHAVRTCRISDSGSKIWLGIGPAAAHDVMGQVSLHFQFCTNDQGFIQLNPGDLAVQRDARRGFQTISADCQFPILRRKWLLVDIDPVRPTDTNSTNDQLREAADTGRRIIQFLLAEGWSEPVVASSGNGIHLLFRVDLPTDDVTTALVKNCLQQLAQRFSSEALGIDKSVFDLPRLTRWYGTINRKGPATPDTPQRRSMLLFVPETIEVTPRAQLEALAGTDHVETDSLPIQMPEDLTRLSHLTVQQFLSVLADVRPSGNGWSACCPAHPDTKPSMSVSQGDDGKILVHCHAGCQLDDILKRLGFRASQLFPAKANCTTFSPGQKEAIAAHDPGLAYYAEQCRVSTNPDFLEFFANQLGVHASALEALGVGWSHRNGAWTIPERNSNGEVVGILLRFPDGAKLCIRGSHRGVILPDRSWEWTGDVYVPEGASDVAAFLSAGIQAIGRPTASSLSELPAFLMKRPLITPIIVGENDRKPDGSWPGAAGARKCASELSTALNRTVTIVFPPDGSKDVRDLLRNIVTNRGVK